MGGEMKRGRLASVCFGVVVSAGALSVEAKAESFSFVALGDTAYNVPADYAVYEALIATINKSDPAFSIHVGDIWGAADCGDESMQRIYKTFQKYEEPLIYTPGDNEWVDCRKPEIIQAYHDAKGDIVALLQKMPQLLSVDSNLKAETYADSADRLDAIRSIFFAKRESLGQSRIPLVRQGDGKTHKKFVENVRWEHGGVTFATINVPGSQNGFDVRSEKRAAEAVGRNRANVAWLQDTFADAKAKDAKAVVISLQASLFTGGWQGTFTGQDIRGDEDGPYYWIVWAIRDLSTAFGRPVLVINGDFHAFLVDKPFRVTQGEGAPPKYDNITRLQVFGAPDIRAVTVSVDTETPWVFGFTPLYN
jgi:hypothetical protein